MSIMSGNQKSDIQKKINQCHESQGTWTRS